VSYYPGQGSSITQISQQIATLKQANLDGSDPINITAGMTLAYGKLYHFAGSASLAATLPAAPSTGEGFLAIKVMPGATGTLTVNPPTGVTIDGQASFTMAGAGQENGFALDAGATIVDVM
jgi:hypothetical protein